MSIDHFDIGTLRLSQAKGLVEAIGMAACHDDFSGTRALDAANGIIDLLEQAHEAFRCHWEEAKAAQS